MPARLSQIEQETLLLLGKSGSGGNFDQIAMAKLFILDLVEVRSSDRRLALTEAGRAIFDALKASANNGHKTHRRTGKFDR